MINYKKTNIYWQIDVGGSFLRIEHMEKAGKIEKTGDIMSIG
jgi:hypothetical protein